MAKKKTTPRFHLGDRVQIRYSDWKARIVELRGPLAPGGVFVYRVRVPHKPKPIYIELPEDELTAIPTPAKASRGSLASPVSESPKQPGDGATARAESEEERRQALPRREDQASHSASEH